MNYPLHPHDIESFDTQNELQNCLSEAMPYAVAQRGPIPHHGAGPVKITVSEPVFCKSTDGFAGMMISETRRFPTEAAASAWIKTQYHELSFAIENERKTKLLAKIAATYTGWCGNPLNHDWRKTLQNFRETARKAFVATRHGDHDTAQRSSLRESFAAAIFAAQCAADTADRECPF